MTITSDAAETADTSGSKASGGQSASSPLRSPWQVTKAVWYALILREIQTRFWSRRFGAFWVLAEPILHVLIMVLIFSFIRSDSITSVPFALWLVLGIVPFFMMREIVFGTLGAVKGNKALFTYRQVKPFDTYVARAILQVMVYTTVLVLLVSAMVFLFGYPIPIYRPIELLSVFGVMVALAFGLGILFSLLVQALPDVEPIVRLLFFPLYLLSGVIFPLSFIPAKYLEYLLWNPFLHLIDLFRQFSLAGYSPIAGTNLTYPAEFALVLLFFGLLIYRERQYDLVTD